MANEFVINIYTDGTDWGDTIIAAPHNFLRCNILFASICMLIVKSEPRGKGESTNLISHHTPHLLPDQKHKPTAAKLHYALLIMAPKIFFQGVFPRNKCLKQGRRNKSQWWANGVSQVQHNLCTAAPFWLHFQGTWQGWSQGPSTKLEGFIRHWVDGVLYHQDVWALPSIG